VSSDQAHPTIWFCLPLQQKLWLHEVTFPWHDGHSCHAQRILVQQHCPVTTKNYLGEINCQSDAIIVTLLHQQCNCAHNRLLCTIWSTVCLHSFATSLQRL
jgi:hypothetical protein